MRARHAIPFTFLLVGMVVGLPVIIPVAVAMKAIEERRKRNAACLTVCIACSKVLGAESIRLADDAARAEMDELRRSRPGVKFRIVQSCHSICPACGARYTYRAQTRTFVPEKIDTSAGGR